MKFGQILPNCLLKYHGFQNPNLPLLLGQNAELQQNKFGALISGPEKQDIDFHHCICFLNFWKHYFRFIPHLHKPHPDAQETPLSFGLTPSQFMLLFFPECLWCVGTELILKLPSSTTCNLIVSFPASGLPRRIIRCLRAPSFLSHPVFLLNAQDGALHVVGFF